jgi:hypothetical protein
MMGKTMPKPESKTYADPEDLAFDERQLNFVRPPQFMYRPVDENGQRQTAIKFFEEHWAPLLRDHTICGDDLRNIDRRLYDALASALRREKRTLSSIFPPSPTRGHIPSIRSEQEHRERRQRLTALRVARWRQERERG